MAKGIFIGLATIDLVYAVDEFPIANTKVVARRQDVLVGGPATNACIAFCHLGGQGTLVSAVGRHPLAGAIKEELKRYSAGLVDLNGEFDEAPAISSVVVNGRGERNVVSANATRVDARPAKVDEGALKDADFVMLDGHHMEACQVWARAAKERGIGVVVDGGSWKDGTEELLKNADTAICSADFRPPGCHTEEDVLAYLKDCGVTYVAITKGAEPVSFVSAGISGVVRAPQVDVVDTMGAGDIFHGAFCYYAAAGHGFVEALVEATTVAGESCRYRGTREWMRLGTG